MSSRIGNIGTASVDIRADLKNLTRTLKSAQKEVENSSKRMTRSFGRLEGALFKLDNSVFRVGRNLRGLAGAGIAVAAALKTREIIQYADAWTRLTQQLGSVIDSSEGVQAAQKRLFDIAQESRVEISTASDVFVRFARVSKEAGISQESLFDAVSNLSSAITLSGRTSAEASAGLLQLSQAFGKGVLDGDELKTVMEVLPDLATALAQDMGVTTGALRDLGAEGKITREIMLSAFERLPSILGDVSEAPLTVGQSLTRLGNSVGRLVGEFDEATGFSGIFASSLDAVASAASNAATSLEDTAEAQEKIAAAQKILGETGVADNFAGPGIFQKPNKNAIAFIETLDELDKAAKKTAEALELQRDVGQDRTDANRAANVRIREADAKAIAKQTEEIEKQQKAARDLSNALSRDLEVAGLSQIEQDLAGLIDGLGAELSVVGDQVVSKSITNIDQLRSALEATNARDMQKEFDDLSESLRSQAQAAGLSSEMQMRLATEMDRLGASFTVVNGVVSNVDLPVDQFEALQRAVQNISVAEANQALGVFLEDLQKQAQVSGVTDESQKRLAETLETLGIAFEIVGGRIRSTVIEQEKLNQLADGLDAQAYDELQTKISEYVSEIERATRAEGLESDQQREIVAILDELGVAWENVGGKVKLASDAVASGDLARITEAVDTAALDEAQRKLDDYVRTAEQSREIVSLSSAAQREFAEALKQAGVEFEVAGGKVVVLNDNLQRTNEVLESIESDQAAAKLEELKQAGEDFGASFTDAVGDVILEGRKLSDVFDSLVKQIARLAIQQAIGSGTSSLFGSLFSAAASGFTGTVTSTSTGAQVSGAQASGQAGARFAAGGIIRGPVNIGANGVAGEAGPEAIVPLHVGAGGKLGIDASGIGGGGANVVVNDFRRTGADVEVQETESDGQRTIEVTVRDTVNRLAGQGALDPTFSTIGASRRPVRR